MRETRHYLGLELAGAKNQKTAVATLEYYPREKKVFLLDIYEKIASVRTNDSTSHPAPAGTGALGPNGVYGLTTGGDEALVELLHELVDQASAESTRMGVNVPLELPPGISWTKTAKPLATAVASVKWMREATRKAERQFRTDPRGLRVIEFTAYTQRPIELWIRYQVLSKLPDSHRFEIDETLGGNKAPLTARMNLIRRHLGDLSLLEVWPKLSMSLLSLEMDLPRRIVQSYRHLEQGVHAREVFLETLSERHGIFVYERDIRKLSQSLPAFDAFVCAYTALLSDTQRCVKPPSGFPLSSGWVHYPA